VPVSIVSYCMRKEMNSDLAVLGQATSSESVSVDRFAHHSVTHLSQEAHDNRAQGLAEFSERP
jgi:hypothetical protein